MFFTSQYQPQENWVLILPSKLQWEFLFNAVKKTFARWKLSIKVRSSGWYDLETTWKSLRFQAASASVVVTIFPGNQLLTLYSGPSQLWSLYEGQTQFTNSEVWLSMTHVTLCQRGVCVGVGVGDMQLKELGSQGRNTGSRPNAWSHLLIYSRLNRVNYLMAPPGSSPVSLLVTLIGLLCPVNCRGSRQDNRTLS